MKNRTSLVILAVLLVIAGFVFRFTDWFSPRQIQISYRIIPGRGKPGSVEPVVFLLNQESKVTSIRVYSLDEEKTNAHPHDLWHLVAITNAVPVTDFPYGGPLPGLRPFYTNSIPEALATNGNYRIVVQAGKIKGQRDFTARATVGTP